MMLTLASDTLLGSVLASCLASASRVVSTALAMPAGLMYRLAPEVGSTLYTGRSSSRPARKVLPSIGGCCRWARQQQQQRHEVADEAGHKEHQAAATMHASKRRGRLRSHCCWALGLARTYRCEILLHPGGLEAVDLADVAQHDACCARRQHADRKVCSLPAASKPARQAGSEPEEVFSAILQDYRISAGSRACSSWPTPCVCCSTAAPAALAHLS